MMTITLSDGTVISEEEIFAMMADVEYNDYTGPSSHCEDCGREYGMYCVGPVKYGLQFLCKDCKRDAMQDEFQLRSGDTVIATYRRIDSE